MLDAVRCGDGWCACDVCNLWEEAVEPLQYERVRVGADGE